MPSYIQTIMFRYPAEDLVRGTTYQDDMFKRRKTETFHIQNLLEKKGLSPEKPAQPESSTLPGNDTLKFSQLKLQHQKDLGSAKSDSPDDDVDMKIDPSDLIFEPEPAKNN